MVEFIPAILFVAEIILAVNALVFWGRLPVMAALSVSFVVFVAFQSVVFNILSVFELVNYFFVLIANVALVSILSLLLFFDGKFYLFRTIYRSVSVIKRCFFVGSNVCYIVIVIIVGIIVFIYPPNNYDSMVYHMPRVAHWIQNGSVAYYPTPIDRQNIMGPGAEYFILFFQLLSGSDRCSILGQFISFILLVPSCIYVCRVLGVGKKYIFYIVSISITAPVALCQASNTKNDLIAALVVYAVVLSSRRLIFGCTQKVRSVDIALLATSLSVGFLVKPTSVLVAVPLVFVLAFPRMFGLMNSKKNLLVLLKGGGVGIVCFLFIAGADVSRKLQTGVARHEVYPLLSEYSVERLWNPVRILAHNLPFRKQSEAQILYDRIGGIGEFRTRDVFNFSEDMIGAPYQVLTFLFLSFATSAGGVFLFFVSGWNKWLVSLAPLISWGVFGLIVRDQAWITRLQVPLYYLLPFSFVFPLYLAGLTRFSKRIVPFLLAGCAFLSLAYGFIVVANNSLRPIILSHFWGERPNRVGAYYNASKGSQQTHDNLIEIAKRDKCSRVGLLLGPDSVEYPLTWRIVQNGGTVQHLWDAVEGGGQVELIKNQKVLDQSCLVYVADGSLEHAPKSKDKWIESGDPHILIRDYSWDFNNSAETCLSVNTRTYMETVVSVQGGAMYSDGALLVQDVKDFDPQVILNNVGSCGANDIVMKVDIDSPVNTIFQVFFQTDSEKFYSEKNSLSRQIFTGGNSLYFHLSKKWLVGPVRIDVGKEVGMYRIKLLEIKNI